MQGQTSPLFEMIVTWKRFLHVCKQAIIEILKDVMWNIIPMFVVQVDLLSRILLEILISSSHLNPFADQSNTLYWIFYTLPF
jgi:hypothetical protein